MNAVFELEANSLRKLVKDLILLVLHISGQIVSQNSPAVTIAISMVIGSWQGESKLIFEISKVTN